MHKLMLTLARIMAVFGGLVLTFLILMTCVSIVGRELNAFFNSDFAQGSMPGLANWLLEAGIKPVLGDFELVEAGMAFAIFAFLPLCQITGSHATVDVFTARFPASINRALSAVIEVIFAVVMVVIAWKLYDGMASKMRYGETTYLIQFPIWWAYAISLIGAVLAAIVAVYMAIMRVLEFAQGRPLLPLGEGAEL